MKDYVQIAYLVYAMVNTLALLAASVVGIGAQGFLRNPNYSEKQKDELWRQYTRTFLYSISYGLFDRVLYSRLNMLIAWPTGLRRNTNYRDLRWVLPYILMATVMVHSYTLIVLFTFLRWKND